jgi:hypothetical protein
LTPQKRGLNKNPPIISDVAEVLPGWWFVLQKESMAKHFTKKESRFQIEFRPTAQATAHGGSLAVHALGNQLG